MNELEEFEFRHRYEKEQQAKSDAAAVARNPTQAQILRSAAEGYGGAINMVDRAWSGLFGAAARPFDEEESDRIFKEMEARTAKRSTWKNKIPVKTDPNLAERALGTVAALPAIIPAALLSPFETSQEMVKSEPSLGKGAAAIGISSAGNAIGFGAPGAIGKTLLTKAATGAAINPAQALLQSKALQGVADSEETKKKFEPTADELYVQAIFGGALGPLGPTRPAKAPRPNIQDIIKDDLSRPVEAPVAEAPQAKSTAMTPSQLKAWKETQDKFAAYKQEQEALARQQAAQQALEARQKALEGDVARQTSLDMNAAERARQEAAGTGYEAWAESQRQAANERLPRNNDPLKLPRQSREAVAQDILQQKGLGEEPYRPENMVEPDSTLFLKQNTLPLEIQDILGQKSEPTLSQKIQDVLKSGESPEEMARRLALPVDVQEILRSPHTLPEKVQTALNGGPKKSRGVGKGGVRGSVSRGAISLDIFDPFFKREKTLPNGVRLVFTGDSESPEIKAYGPRGNEVGELKLSSDNIYRQSSNDNLVADWVSTQKNTVPDFHAAEMYKFAAEIGNDIVPSKVQTTDGKAMWQGFERKGISTNGKVSRGLGVGGGGMKGTVSRGAVDFGLMDKVDEYVKNNQTLKAVQDIVKDRWYQEKTSPEDTIARALAEGKDSSGTTNWSAGANLEGLKRRSAAIEGVGRIVQREGAIAEDLTRTHVFPVEKAFRGLSKLELGDVAEVLKAELFARKTLSQSALEKGFNEKQMLAYSKLREAFRKTHEELNAVRKMQGLPEITELEHYVSSVWQGDFRTLIKDANGKTIWALADGSKRGLEKQKKALFKQFPDLAKSAEDFTMRSTKKGNTASDMYSSLLDTLGRDDPAVKAMSDWMEAHAVGEARNFLNEEKHFLAKGNTRGFIGDRPGTKPHQEQLALVQAQINYMKQSLQWAALQRSAEGVKKIINSPELQKQQPNNVKYIREYWLNQLGANEHEITRGFENMLRGAGYSPTEIYKTVGGLKNIWTTQKIGVNAGFSLSNALQAANMLPHLVDMRVKYGGNTFSAIAAGAGLGPLLATGHVFANRLAKSPEALYRAMGLTMTREQAVFNTKAMKYAEDNSVVTRSVYDESPIESSFSTGGKVLKAVGSTITLPETYLRSIAYMTYVHQLKDSGKFANEMDIFRMAEERVNSSMGDYRQAERAPVFNKAGIVGNAASTLSTFPINYYNQWGWAMREAGKKNFMPALTMLAVQGYMAGLMGVPGFSDADKLIEFLKEHVLAPLSPSTWAKVKDFGLKDMTLQLPGGGAITYGSASEDSGVSITSRAAAPSPFEMMQTPGAPVVEGLQQAGNVLNAASSGFTDPQKNAQALHDSMFSGLQGYLETGPLRDQYMNGDVSMSNDLASRRGQYRRTSEEDSLRAWGFRSQKEAVTKDLDWRLARRQRTTADVIRKLPDKLYNEIRKGNVEKATDFVKLYAELSGKKLTNKQLQTQVMQEFTSAQERHWTGRQMPLDRVVETKRMEDLLKKLGY